MKSIKTNPNSAKEPDKGNIFKQIVLHILGQDKLSVFRNIRDKISYRYLGIFVTRLVIGN